MKHEIEVRKNALTPEDFRDYSAWNPGYTPTGETLKESFSDGGSVTHVVFKGPYTRYGMCRDCGDHYIIARYTRYDRIYKATLEITKDVEDN